MKEEFRPDAWHNAVGPKPVIKAGDRVKVVRGFNVGARGTVLRVSPDREAQSWDCWVRRDLAGDSDEMGYRFDELVVVDAEVDPIAKYFDKAAAKRAERDEQLLVMAGVKPPEPDLPEFTGGSVSYYAVRIEQPVSGGDPYTAECLDIIEALGMDYAEGNAFKAIWRRCAARMDKLKKGYDDGLYDAEKTEFYGRRMVEISKRRRENSA